MTENTADTVTRYTLDVPDSEIADLRERLSRTRWADAVADDWQRGTAPSALRALVERWAEGYDWKATERRLNQLDHYTYQGLHFVRAGTRGKQPLLLLHGWPDSFLRFETILPLLADDFDLIVPSLPGFGLTERPAAPGIGAAQAADRIAALMGHLGFDRYGVHGGDCGGMVGELLALRHREHISALHLTDLPFWHLFGLDPAALSPEEQQYLQKSQEWAQREGAYIQEHATKPQTLGYGLNDSPVALASWHLEKFESWTDGGVDKTLGIDAVLDNLSLYWFTQTGPSSVRFYFENFSSIGEVLGALAQGPIPVPTAFANFPADHARPPRTLVERSFNVQHWADMPAGGHFTAWEQPEALAADLRVFFSGVA